MKSCLIIIAMSLLFIGTQSQTFSQSGGKLLLKSGFEQGVLITDGMAALNGSDVPGFSWDDNRGWIGSSRFVYIVNSASNVSDFMESAIETQIGPKGNKTRVLRMTNIKDDPKAGATSRNEYSFFGKESPDDYQEGYVRYWMKFQENVPDFIPFEESSPFYMIMEWKEPDSKIRKSADECKDCCDSRAGGTNNYRININMHKDANSKDFFWLIRGERPQPCRVEEWRYLNKDVKVSFGEWFLVEAYMKKHETRGRVYFAINGEVILDTRVTTPDGFIGRTQHPDNPMNLRFWSALKNYHGKEWNKYGGLSQWYDDFELWSSFPPGHSAGN